MRPALVDLRGRIAFVIGARVMPRFGLAWGT